MIVETRLYKLAEHVQDLLCCDGVCVVLGCSEPALRHPLLQRLVCAGSEEEVPLAVTVGYAISYSQNEAVRALCDLAIQTGQMWCIDHFPLLNGTIGSVAVLPLEQPMGILGLLLFTSLHPESFHTGESALLAQFAPVILQKVVAILECSPLLAANESAKEALEAQTPPELLSVVSHEIRMPLAAMKGYVGLLQAYGLPMEQRESSTTVLPAELQRHYLNSVMEQIDHLEILVRDLLDTTRLQNGHLALHCSQVDLIQLCRRVTEHMQYRVDQQQPGVYAIRCYATPELPDAWADAARVQQILTNLLENAVKYSPNGGIIEILLEVRARPPQTAFFAPPLHAENGYPLQEQLRPWSTTHHSVVAITVRDKGIGIPERQQPELFKPFTRLAHPLTSSVPGSGLGLYISQKLVEALGGQMALTSHEGQGTSVTFTLPTIATGSLVASDVKA